MKNQELRSSLIKSGILLILGVFFIYAFAAGDSGGVAGTISSIFSATIFLFGMALALAVCVAVIFGIYFGILYMYNPQICTKTYAEFKAKLANSSQSLTSKCSSKCSSSKKPVAVTISDEDLHPLRSDQAKLSSQLSGLESGISTLEQNLTVVSSSVASITEEITKLDGRAAAIEEELENKASASSIDDAAKKLTGDISAVQNSLKPLNDKITELENSLSSLSTETEEDNGDEVQEKIDTALSGVKSEIKAMADSIEKLAKQPNPAKAEAAPAPASTDTDGDEHRILPYFNTKKDRAQFISLVDKAVADGKTYAQIGEILSNSLSAAAAKVTNVHPSLTKDYIKTIRLKK